MAGFGKDERYSLPRSRCVPCDELRRLIFPWLEYVFQVLDDSEKEGGKHPTARLTFEYYRELRDVILQDVAAMCLQMDAEDPVRSHTVFKLPVFQSELFREFVVKMDITLEKARRDEADHGTKAVDQLLPGVNRKFEDVTKALGELKIEAEEAKKAANAAAESAEKAAASAEKAATAARSIAMAQVSSRFFILFVSCLLFRF